MEDHTMRVVADEKDHPIIRLESIIAILDQAPLQDQPDQEPILHLAEIPNRQPKIQTRQPITRL